MTPDERLEKLPYGIICFDCAIKMGAKCQGGHTVYEDKCPYCKEQKGVSTISDYIWPKEYGVNYVWD